MDHEPLPIFVYGTLQRGEERAACWPGAPLRVEAATVRAQLYDLGPYPAILEGDGCVSGELWHIAPEDHAQTLEVLDEIECFGWDAVDLYVRRIVECQVPGRPPQRAYAYFLADPAEARRGQRMLPDADGQCRWRRLPAPNSSAGSPRATLLDWLKRGLGYTWASPYTAIGLTVGLAGLVSGGRVQVRRHILEFHGGGVRWFVNRLPGGVMVQAITFGHTVLGRSAESLDECRDHEMVHVRQYERWGPLFGFAYLGCSALLWWQGRDPYLENPFEREAFERDASLAAPAADRSPE